VTRSDGEVVFQQLEQTMPRTGVPRDIVSAEGAELHAGVSQFCRAHPATASISDITHKTALVFQHALQSDTAWDTFCQRASDTRNHVQQTPLAALAPPKQRSTARSMTTDRLLVWGERRLGCLDSHLTPSPAAFDPTQIEEH
jgi:hypothetical protein